MNMGDRRHQADIVSPGRLQGFSDAVFATAATLLVVPIRKFELEDKETLREALNRHWLRFVVFVFGYLVICAVWESHIIRFKLFKKVDDVVVVLTLISLMVITFLPFTIELESFYIKHKTPIILCSILLVCIELLELCIFMYGFYSPKLLTESFNELVHDEKVAKKRQIYAKISINCAIFVASAVLSPLSYVASSIIVCFVILTPLLRRLMVKLTRHFSCCHYESSNQSSFQMLTGRTEKERIECFSDAALAIIATLLVLDLTTEDFPKESEVIEYGLNGALMNMWQKFVAYMATYGLVAILWFVHHSVIQKIEIFTPLMVLLNHIFLAFTAFSPFISTLVNKYTGHITHNGEVAVRISCLLILVGSLMNLLILLCSISQEEETLYEWAITQQHQQGNRSRLYLLIKTLIIPTASLITFLCSLNSKYAAFISYHVVIFIVPLLFILLKIIFTCNCIQDRGEEEQATMLNATSVEELFNTQDSQPMGSNNRAIVQ